MLDDELTSCPEAGLAIHIGTRSERLEQPCPGIRLVPRARGRIALDVACHVPRLEQA